KILPVRLVEVLHQQAALRALPVSLLVRGTAAMLRLCCHAAVVECCGTSPAATATLLALDRAC
ncbi:hypothetical protein ABTF44_20575, partial [Acinetobacter baumannii]